MAATPHAARRGPDSEGAAAVADNCWNMPAVRKLTKNPTMPAL